MPDGSHIGVHTSAEVLWADSNSRVPEVWWAEDSFSGWQLQQKLPEKYFEDEYQNVVSKHIPWPKVANLCFECLPLIDEHNKQHQKLIFIKRLLVFQECML